MSLKYRLRVITYLDVATFFCWCMHLIRLCNGSRIMRERFRYSFKQNTIFFTLQALIVQSRYVCGLRFLSRRRFSSDAARSGTRSVAIGSLPPGSLLPCTATVLSSLFSPHANSRAYKPIHYSSLLRCPFNRFSSVLNCKLTAKPYAVSYLSRNRIFSSASRAMGDEPMRSYLRSKFANRIFALSRLISCGLFCVYSFPTSNATVSSFSRASRCIVLRGRFIALLLCLIETMSWIIVQV